MFRLFLSFTLLIGLLLPLQAATRTEIPTLNHVPASDWTNVKDHGVVGDGATDDTVALQALLTDLREGSILYFPPGVYRITRELLIQKSTENNPKEKRLIGIGFYGHGAQTVLKYDGEPGAVMLRIRGMLHYRMDGFVFNGSGKARVGMYHDNKLPDTMHFETHLYHSFITMRGFTDHGILFGKLDDNPAGASAETTFQHMIFEDCGTGITFNNFNDYNFTFDGCIFRDNARMGVECVNGNFYVRNSRFERNGLDVFANPEHSSSIRRSVSVGSGAFLHFQNGVSPFTVENCLVIDWKNDVAIKTGGAPLLAFDNRFVSTAPKTAAIEAKRDQHVVHTANTVEGVSRLFLRDSDTYVTSELSSKSPLTLRADMSVMPTTVELPSRRFDAKTDFGAVGDGKADDTAAIQAAIDAARTHGKGVMAYLPKGDYRITRPLRLEGGGYSFGGGTVYSELHFDGDKDADALVVAPEGNLTLDTFRIRRTAVKIIREDRDEGWRVRTARIGEFDGKGADIRQLPSANGSRVLYHTVYVSGKYIEMPFALGMQFDGLREHDTVLLHNIEGNLQFANSGDATILHTVGYEGTFWVRGENRKGFLGVMTRLATRSKHSIYVEDSQSFVASDFYEEQAPPEGIVLTGKPGDTPGCLTLGFVKVDRIVHVRNYTGQINLVATQFYLHRSHGNPGIDVVGEQPEINFFASFFYVPKLVVDPTDTQINFVGSTGSSAYSSAELDGKRVHLVDKIENSITDLRKLGQVDWQLNYPDLLAQ
jgi:hypothetical protein